MRQTFLVNILSVPGKSKVLEGHPVSYAGVTTNLKCVTNYSTLTLTLTLHQAIRYTLVSRLLMRLVISHPQRAGIIFETTTPNTKKLIKE